MLNQRTFSLFAGIIFSLVALGHLLRLVYGATVDIGGWIAPMWISWVGLFVAGYLAICGFALSRRKLLGML